MKHIEVTYKQFCDIHKCIRALSAAGIDPIRAFDLTIRALNENSENKQTPPTLGERWWENLVSE